MFLSLGNRSEYEADILIYISGRIQRTLLEKEECDECALFLQDPVHRISSMLIEVKDLGGLKRPHEDVCTVVGTCEKTFKAFTVLEEISHTMVFPRMKIRTLQTLAEFYPTIFNGEHFISLPMNNHRNSLIKRTIHQYLNMRLKHYYSEKNKLNPGNRQMNSRVTIFRNE